MFAQAAIALVVGLAGSGIGIKVAVTELTVRVDDISATLNRTEERGALLFENKLAITNSDAKINSLEREMRAMSGAVAECMRRDVAQGAHEAMMGRLQALEHERSWYTRMARRGYTDGSEK